LNASGTVNARIKICRKALSLAPSNVNSLLNYASLQWKLGQKDAAQALFWKVLELDKSNRTALSSLGYLARDNGMQNWPRVISDAPSRRIPRITNLVSLWRFVHGSARLSRGRKELRRRLPAQCPATAMIIAGGTNAALEAHNPNLRSAGWIGLRAN